MSSRKKGAREGGTHGLQSGASLTAGLSVGRDQCNTTMRAAQVTAYADSGLAVIPLRSRSKRPLVAWSQYQATPPDRGLVQTWLRDYPRCNWAVLTGTPSGNLVVLDFDTRPDYERWAAAWPDVAQAAPTVGTARGAHVYLVGPPAQRTARMCNFAGEIKAAGGYVLVPPSVHPSGAFYRWLHGDPVRYVPAVEDLRQVGIEVNQPATPIAPTGRAFPTGRTPNRLKPCTAAILGSYTPAGRRNATCFRLALHLRSEGWSEAAALYLLAPWWQRSAVAGEGGQRDAELARTVGSAYRPDRRAGHGCRSGELSGYCQQRCPLAAFRSGQ